MKNSISYSFIAAFFLFFTCTQANAQWQWLSPGYTNAGSYSQGNRAVAVDPSGCVYTTGVYTNQTNSEIQIPLRKFAPDGKLLFAKLYNTGYGNDNLEQGNDVGVSLSNNTVVIGGQQHGGKPYLGFFRADNGTATIAPIAFSGYGFIQKIDIKGNEVWAIGRFDNNLSLGNGAPTLTGNSSYYGNVFVARYNLVTGAFISAFYMQSAYIWGYDIKIDAANRAFVTARTAGVVTFKNSSNLPTGSSYTQPAANLYDAFLAKVDANGTANWVQSLSNAHGELHPDDRYPIAYVSVQADFVVVGGFNQTKANSFLQKRLSTTGALQSQVPLIAGKGLSDIGYAPCSQSIYVVGTTASLPTSCTSGLFLDRYNFGGNLSFAAGQSSNACASGTALAIDGVGMPIVTGNYSGGLFTINNQTINVANTKGVVTGRFVESNNCCSNRGLILDGTDDYLKPNTLPLSGSGNFTFEAWINSTSSGVFGGNCYGAFRRLLSWGVAGGHQVEIGDCNGILLVQYTGLNGSGASWPTGTAVRNVWNHIALVRNGNNLTLYVNGVFQFSSPTTPISFPSNSAFYIGRPVSAPNGIENWKGRIDEVRLWNVARSATQVFDKKGCRLKGNEQGLLVYYPFENGLPNLGNQGANIAYNYAPLVTQHATLYNFALTGGLSNWICASQTGLTMNGTCTPFAPDPGGEERSEEEDAEDALVDAADADLKIFPNPNNGAFKVRLAEPAPPGMTLRILGLSGQVLLEKQAEEGADLQALEAGELPAGLYFLQMVSENRVTALKKFVKE